MRELFIDVFFTYFESRSWDEDIYFYFCVNRNFWLYFKDVSKIQIIFSNLNSNCSNLWDMRNLQEQVKKVLCYQKLFWPFTVWMNCFSDLKNFANSRPSASNIKSFSRPLEQFFLTVGQINFGSKIPFFLVCVLTEKTFIDL